MKSNDKVPCPECRGKFYVSPKTQKTIGLCHTCDGNGFVYLNIVCLCGRPAVKHVHGANICSLNMCEKRAKNGTAKTESHNNIDCSII